MKTPHLAFAAAAFALVGVIYGAIEYGWLSFGAPRMHERGSDAAGQPPAMLARSADQSAVVPEDGIVAATPATAFATAAEVAALRQELSDLGAALADLRRQTRRATAATNAPDDQVVEKPRMDANTLAQEEQQRAQEMDIQESAFRQERADAAWSSQASSQVEEALAGLAGAPAAKKKITKEK